MPTASKSARAAITAEINKAIPYFETPTEGKITMNGKEQILFEKTDGKIALIEGMVNLSPMQAGDTIILREYMQTLATGEYALYAEQPYVGAQLIPLTQILTRISTHNIKITIQQTTGTYREFEYSFTRRRQS